MPSINVEENIMRLRRTIQEMTEEVFRLQGSLRTLMEFQKAGVKEVDAPENVEPPAEAESSAEEETSTQE